jgi:hypothetical protein
MRIQGYAAEVLGLSPYWKRRPQLRKLMVVYQAPDGSDTGNTAASWASIEGYLNQYLHARGCRPASGSVHFSLSIQAAHSVQALQARLRESLADPNLAVLVVVYSPSAEKASEGYAIEPANPSLQLHRIACEDSENPRSASTRRQLYSALLTGLAHCLSVSRGVTAGEPFPAEASVA